MTEAVFKTAGYIGMKIEIELDEAEWYVLFELLEKIDAEECSVADYAEEVAMWRFVATIEPHLGRVFSEDYTDFIASCRRKLTEERG